MSYTSVVHCLGWSVLLLAGLMIFPALTAMFEGSTQLAWTFGASGVLSGFFGGGFALATRQNGGDFGKREAFMFLVLVWLVLAFFGAIPLYFSGIPLHPIDAYFESISGLTTTGATTFVGLEAMPPAILLWRALLQWAGGFLTIVLAVSLIAHLGVGGMGAFQSALPRGEGGSLPARMLQTTRDLLWIYLLLTLVGALALWGVGMSAFEGLCHAFSGISTGGFSTRDDSVAGFGAPLVELILMIIMLIGAVNFTLHWAVFNGQLRVLRENTDVYYLSVTLAVLTLAFLLVSLWRGNGDDFLSTFRVEIFTTISALTTSGFSNNPIRGPAVVTTVVPPVLIVGLILAGGCFASTTGGIRLNRIAILFKQAQRELSRLTFPHGVGVLRLGTQRIENSIVWSVWGYFFGFFLVLVAIALALAFFEFEASTAIAAATVMISNAGPLLHAIVPEAPKFVEMSAGAKITLIIGMLAGRVELLALLSLLNPVFWNR